MLALLGISTICSLVASTVLGIRLIRLYLRTREVPEGLMGSAFLVAGVVGYSFMLVGAGGAEQMPADVAHLCFLVGYALISLGVILTYLFVWRVFQPGSLVARAFMGIVCPVVAVTGLPFAMPTLDAPGPELQGGALFVFWLGHAARIGSGAWGGVEAGRYWLRMRRRLRIGLAEPAVTNRIGLWALAMLGSVVIFSSTAHGEAVETSMNTVMSPARIVLISTVTLGVAACQWLAFLPPAWYRRLVERRASRPA